MMTTVIKIKKSLKKLLIRHLPVAARVRVCCEHVCWRARACVCVSCAMLLWAHVPPKGQNLTQPPLKVPPKIYRTEEFAIFV